MASPAFSYIDGDDIINSQFELDDLNKQIANLGFDPDAAESKIGDLPDNTPDFLVRDVLNIEDPVDLQRKKAAIKWQAPIARSIENIADPVAKQKAKEEMSWVYNGIRGDEKSNYQSALSATKAAVDIIRKHGGDTEDMLKNLKFDSEYGLAKMMLVDPSAQKRWESLGLNPIQGIALDMKELFDPNGAEYKKQVTSKVTEPSAVSEQNFKKAELERYGTQILGGQIDYLLGKKASAVDKANAFYDENKGKLEELGNTIKNDTKLTEEMKVKLAGFQKEYNDAKNGKDGEVYISPYSFEYLKEKIDAKTASAYEIKQYNTMVGNMNRIVGKYKGAFDEYNQTASEQNAAVREYNKIVNKIQESYQVMGDYNNLSGWAEYLAKQRNTLGERYPEYKQIELEGLVKDIAGDNVGLGEKTVVRLAGAIGSEAVDGINKAWNNLTIWDGDKLREVEMGDAYRRRVEDVMMNYETGDQMLKDERSVIPVVPKVVQDELNKIKNSSLSEEEKYQQNYQIISKAFDDKKIKYVANPKYGKYNLTSGAILNTISSVSSQFIGQMAQSYLSGGFGNVSKLRRLTTLFGTTAAQTFSREYDAAVQRGDSKPFEQALTKSAIEGLSELPFDNIEFVKKLSPQVRKIAGDMTDAQWKAFRAGKIPSNLGREFVNAVESVVKEGALEEGLAQVGGNLADKYMFGKDKDITEGLDTAILAGVIGFAPLSIIGLPLKYRSANMGDKLMMYQAGFKADQVIDNLNQQVADGAITAEEAKQRIEAVKLMKEVVGGMSMYDVNGKPLTDNQKAQYAFNEYTKLKAKNIENLPDQQRQEIEQVVKEADQNSSNILNGIEDATNESERVMQGMPAEGNLQQPQGIGQGQQEEGQATQPTANVGYSDISGQEVDIQDVPQGLTEIAAKVVGDAFQAAKSLVKTGIKVRVFQNQADFERESARLGQQARGQGVFVSDGKNILINLSKIKDVNDWGIVWHEGAHPVMNILRNSQPELYNKMAKGFGNLAKQAGVFAQVEGWAQADYGGKTDLSTDEAMVETISLMGDGKIGLQDIPVSFRQQVIDFINTIADYFGLGQLADTSERVFVQKAAQIARALTSGEDIATVVGEENVLRTENPFIGQEKKKGVQDPNPTAKDYKEKEAEVKALVEEQKKTPEAVLIEPQREKDGKLKLSVEFDEDGNRIVEVKFKQAAYDLKNGAKKYVDKDLEKAAEVLSDKIVVDYRDNEARPEIAAGIGWYSKMRQRFQKYFGANIEMFGQLLAATSARTGVFDNFKQSVEAFRLYSQGKYNELLEDYDNYVKDIFSRSEEQLFKEWTADYPTKRPREFDADDYRTKLVNRYDKFPLKENGKKYNANSKKVLQALYGNWLQQTEGPKTKNFAGNLTGRSFGPTIDVWAARYLRRLIFQGNVDRWRIPPSLEKGVDYSILVSGEMSGDYPFAEKVMQMAADKLGINADDLQAFLWYLEKDVWDKNGWTNKSGAEKASFEQGADTLNTERYQAGVTTYKTADTFDPVKFEEERAALQKEIGSLPGVVAARITDSIGEFYSEKDGIYVEPTFDVEFTMEAGSDVTPVRERVEKILKDYKQDATLFSKFVDASHPNARPIIEIGLASPVEKSQIIDDIKNILAQNNVRGFTLAKDTRGRIMGVRSQFVPEFEDGVKIKEGVDRFVKAAEIINAKYGKNPNISYIAASSVDTQVKFQNDGKEAQPNDGDSNAVGPVAQERRQSAARSLPGQQSEPGRDNQGRPGATGRMGQEPGAGQERRSTINWERSPEGKGDPSISSRNPIVVEAAKNLKDGKITNQEYRATVSANSPITPITRFFEPATQQEVKKALSSDKVEKVNSPIKDNTIVGLRLDIPAYTNNNTWVVSVHEGATNAGKAISYRNVARITDVNFGVEPKGALSIAAGVPKTTIGRMFGKWQNMPGRSMEEQGENAKAVVEEIVNDPNYVQIGMNPFRHSYFYDRSSDIGRPVRSADEVIQIGGLVYAKNPVYGDWTDEAYRVKGLLDAAGAPVQFRNTSPFTDVVNGFYSPIEDRINTFKQPKASVQKWKEIVGMKSDEAVFSGMADWLGGMKPDRQLSKEEVLKFMKDNRIEIKEVVKGGVVKGGIVKSEVLERLNDYKYYVFNDIQIGSNGSGKYYVDDNNENTEFFDTINEAIDYANTLSTKEKNTKYSDYQLPGGENYKEVLITLPSQYEMGLKEIPAISKKLQDINTQISNARRNNNTSELISLLPIKNELDVEYENKKANLDKLNKDTFKSSHFDEPNIITHLRMNTRTDADGKKVLFLEEVQSDWGQQGKKEGFMKTSKDRWTLIDEHRIVLNELNKVNNDIDNQIDSGDFSKEDLKSLVSKKLELDKRSEALKNEIFKTTPSAPYVTNTNAWVKLGLKVALKEAVKQGADRIAWTTGEQQNERYDLRNQVDTILWEKDPDGTYFVSAEKDGDIVSTNSGLTPSKLEDSIGKDAAEKILNSPEDNGQLRGLDLAVGGKGMKAFYGDAKNTGIVGNVAKALVKELTGKEGEIVSSKMRTSISPNDFKAGKHRTEQPAIEITPELAQAVQGGMPQFKNSSVNLINDAIQNRMSAAKITSKAIDNITDIVTKLGYGNLPEDVRERLKKKQRLIDADINDMNVLSQRLEKAVKEEYGVTYKNLDDATRELLDNALRNFGTEMSLKQKAAQAKKIPDSVLSIIDDMRATVDGMSLKLIEIGVLDDSLEPAFDNEKGLGVYLTRTYKKYDDPEWVKKVPEPVRQRAIAYLKANNFVKEFDLAGNEIGERELTDTEIEGLVNYIATNMQPVNEGLQSANLGKTKVDITKGRKVIPEEIRDLMGEYKDPMVNFARSIAKMSSLIHTHQTLKAIAEANMGNLFFDRPTGDHYVPVAGEDKNYLQPLAGLYTTPEIAEAFKQVQSSLDGNDVNIRFLRMLAGINGIVKVGKTALSPASWVRNVIGGHIIMMKDAHLFGNGYTDGWKNAIGYFANKSQDSPEFQAKIREYIEQGILGDGVQAGEFKAIVKAAQKHEDPIEWLKEDSKLGKFVGGVKGFYSAQDDIFRVWAYENEKARLEKRKPNMTEAQLQAEASRKARATYPTYSELPEVIRQLAKFIPISSFPAFSAELIRTTKNSIKIAIEEIRDPDMKDVGYKRLAGVISAISFGSILSGLSAMLVGVGGDEEKSIRRYLPEWSKNSPLIWLGRDENGLPKYIDLGFSDPFSYFKKPVVALMNDDESMSDRIKNAVSEIAAPFVSPEIFLSALMKGTKKLKETDDLEDVMGRYAGPVYEALEPGLVASLRRIGKGFMGDVDRYGQQYDPSLELLAFFSGQRIKKMDVPVSFSFKSKDFISSKRDIMSDYYTEKAKTTGDPEKQSEKLADANEKLEKYFDNYKKDYDAAMDLMTRTMTAKTAKKILKQTMKDRNVPEDFIKAIERNKPYPTIEDDK